MLTIDPAVQRVRTFNWYDSSEFWTGNPISYDTWQVNGRVSDVENWSLQDLYFKDVAPIEYLAINFNTVYATSRGFSLNPAKPNLEYSWIGGSEFSILVGTGEPGKPTSIKILMSLPDFMTAQTQTITIIVNHHTLEETYSLDKNKDWIHMEIPIPNGLLKSGNNLVTLKFSETARPKDKKDWHTAGKLKSFRLVQ